MKVLGVLLAGLFVAVLVFLLAALCIQVGFNVATHGVIPTDMTFSQALGVVLFMMGIRMAVVKTEVKNKE